MRLETLINSYDCILSDICGVLHDYTNPIGDASCILKNAKPPVILLSNAAFLHNHTRKLLKERFGIEGLPHIITSGDFALYAQKNGIIPDLEGSKCFSLPQKLGQFADIFGFHETYSLANADFLIALAVAPPTALTAPTHAILHAAYHRGIPLICFNQDTWINKSGAKCLRGGLLAQYYKALGGTTYLCGKPCPNFYKFAFNGIIPEKLLCIGDGLTTDAAGAHAIKRDFLLTAAGNPALFWNKNDSFRQNIKALSARFNVPVPYATWSMSHHAHVECFL